MGSREIRSHCEGCGRRLAEKRRVRGARFCGDACKKAQAEQDWREAHPGARVQCLVCAKPFSFERIRKAAKFCSTTCSRLHHQARYRDARPKLELPAASVAAFAEMVAVACFLKSGFEVYRAVAPAACHLIIERGGVIYRVQVRTVNRRTDGELAATRITKPGADLLCLVARDDFSIQFVPDITAAAAPASQTRRATASPLRAAPPPRRSIDGGAEPPS